MTALVLNLKPRLALRTRTPVPDYVHTFFDRHVYRLQRPEIRCANGFMISVQASPQHGCEPRRQYDGKLRYDEVEVSTRNPHGKFNGYEIEPGIPQYSNVPTYLVNELIHEHGGLSHLM